MDSPVGRLRVLARHEVVIRVDWSTGGPAHPTPVLAEACRQLSAYFDGKLREFDLPLGPSGSEFRQRVFKAMLAIELGQTRTYGDLAELVDGSAQAVGQVCGANPIAIIIPCHRVVAADGLGGYSGAGGIETKVELLRLEAAYSLLI